MTAALIILIALLLVGVVLYIFDKGHKEKSEIQAVVSEPSEAECCGLHITCERDSLLSSVSDKVEYYDDEELDVFRGLQADQYDDEAIEQFREVMLTLLPHDIAGWARSIQLRGIELPSVVRDELLMIVSEARQKSVV